MNNLKKLIKKAEDKREALRRHRLTLESLKEDSSALLFSAAGSCVSIRISGDDMKLFIAAFEKRTEKLEAELNPLEEKLKLLNELLGDANQ